MCEMVGTLFQQCKHTLEIKSQSQEVPNKGSCVNKLSLLSNICKNFIIESLVSPLYGK